MKNVLFSVLIALSIILSACSEEPKQNNEHADNNVRKDTAKQIFMSQETSLRTAEYLTAEIKIPTALCNMCEKNITKAVKKMNGIIKVLADSDKKIATITFDGAKTTTEKIRAVIAKAGYGADNIKRDPSAYEKLVECCKKE